MAKKPKTDDFGLGDLDLDIDLGMDESSGKNWEESSEKEITDIQKAFRDSTARAVEAATDIFDMEYSCEIIFQNRAQRHEFLKKRAGREFVTGKSTLTECKLRGKWELN